MSLVEGRVESPKKHLMFLWNAICLVEDVSMEGVAGEALYVADVRSVIG